MGRDTKNVVNEFIRLFLLRAGVPTSTLTASRALTSNSAGAIAASAVSTTELEGLDGLTASRAIVTDGSGILSAATTTATEIGYVNGVTSAIQTQLGTKQPDLLSPRYVVPMSAYMQSGFGTLTGTAARVFLCPIQINQPGTIDTITIRISTQGGAGTFYRIGIYGPATDFAPEATALLYDSGNIAADAGTGAKTHTLTAPEALAAAGTYFLALETGDGTIVVNRYTTLGFPTDDTGEAVFGAYYDIGGGFGALSDPCPAVTQDSTSVFQATARFSAWG